METSFRIDKLAWIVQLAAVTYVKITVHLINLSVNNFNIQFVSLFHPNDDT
jgi:hypothetical protein